MVQDSSLIKDRIVSILKIRGPSLPVNISKQIGSSILFTSAFLSELASEKMIKISHMRVGSSPVYFLPRQEESLEKFSQFLKSREKDAFLILREKKFLKDREQSPAIRVALREIRDFALPFNIGEEVLWRYYLVPESEFKHLELKVAEEKPVLVAHEIVEKQKNIIEVKEESLAKEIIEQKQERKPKVKKQPVTPKKKKATKKEDNFFSDIKEFVSKNSMELLDIESFGRKGIILKIKDQGENKLLVAYNKNKITENDIINAAKKGVEFSMPYIILGQGGTLKKLDSLIEAIKGLSSIEKLK